MCLRGTDGGPVVRLGEDPIALSPDGKWVIRRPGDRSPDSASHRTREPKALSLPGLQGILAPYPRWFPDRCLAISADEEGGTTMLSRGSRGRRARPLTPRERGSGGLDCWPSPDGKWSLRATETPRSSCIRSVRESRVESPALSGTTERSGGARTAARSTSRR